MSIFAFIILPVFQALGQGAWIPSNADLSFPRTLLKQSEIPAVQAWLTRPEIHPIYQLLYTRAWTYSPGNFNVNGDRRAAAFAAKDAAFALILDRKPVGGGLDTLTDAEATLLRNKSINLLGLMNTTVEAYPDFENYLWRSNELINNLIAYDLLKGAGVPDSSLTLARTKLQEYAGNLHEEVAFDFLNLGFFSLHVDNHALRSAGALGMAAVVLNDAVSSNVEDRPSTWINTSLYQIDNVLFRDGGNAQSTYGQMAGYAEGPHYFRFGMKHVLPFLHALGNFIPDTTLSCSFDGVTRSIRHPWHDPNYALLYEWIIRIRLPDGRFPALEDSFVDVCYPELAITEQARFHAPIFFSRFEEEQINTLWGQLNHSSDDVAADYIAARAEMQPDTFSHLSAMPSSGNLIFRDGWDSIATYLHFTAKNGRARTSAKGHNQADVSSFILVGRGQMLALDGGYLKWDRRLEVAEADNHNMILVDGAGPATGQTANAGDADGFIEDAFDLQRMDYAEVRTSYNGANFVRRPIFMRENYFILGDDCQGSQSHLYQWRLHGYGLEGGDSLHGNFQFDASNSKGVWQKNGVSLQATVVADGGADLIQRATNIHELAYDSMQTHTTLMVDKTGSGARFLAAMIPFEADSPSVQVLCGPVCGALRINRGGYTDIATVASNVASTQTGLWGDLEMDGVMALYSIDSNGSFDQMQLSGGSLLKIGADSLIYANPANDVAYARIDSVNAEGFCTAAGSVRILWPGFVPGTVLGAGVQSWTYDPSTQALTIQFSGGGHFIVLEEVIISAANASHSLFEIEAWPTPARGRVNLKLPPYVGQVDWLDLRGQTLKSWKVSGGDAQIDLSRIPVGIGILRYRSEDGAVETALRIQKLED